MSRIVVVSRRIETLENVQKLSRFCILKKITNFLALDVAEEGVGVESPEESRANVFFEVSS